MEQSTNDDFLRALTDPELLYENAPCGYLSFAADGKIVKVNQTLISWLGFFRAEVVDKLTFKDLVSKGGKIYYEMFYMPLLRMQPMVNEINFDFIRKDGSAFPALINSSVFHNSEGKVVAVNATVYNITDRKKYEKELLDAKKQADSERSKFELLADFTPEIIFTAEPDGEISYVNRRFTSFFGLPAGGFKTRDVLSKVHAQDQFKLIRNWTAAVMAKVDFQMEIRLQTLNSESHWHMVRALPIISATGNVEKWMGSCTDINQHIKAIQHLDEFITVASHELKTPITSLNASLQLMERMVEVQGNAKLSTLMSQANRSVQKVRHLVEDLLHTGSIKEGQISLQKKVFSISDWLAGSCGHVKLEEKFNLHIAPSGIIFVEGDEQRIDQVLVNFVNNAMKYAPGSTDIYISAEILGERVKISVRDLGQGIPADKLPYLFDRYYRVDYTGGSASGLGLGLYICSEIIRRHGGEIGVDSHLGEGSTFWFTLPLFKPDLEYQRNMN
ncbi:PAS domain-containing sensor histidine kinase [Pedobacter psychrodurus]|uniref:histidine kinase n=1 Tax=Pedobacter psychrodurus TaxID=2530456 RepID=A0A4R0Q3W7_9SPHI|nr:PAS domain-containing sensor histidine kinase [Pedobacter psychrodurus]TCD25475.1 PAS domain-containing sensor histidine kinase [Pedobacter psychrodurus]